MVAEGLRMHYVDEGPRTGLPILLLHGEPSWSYLYRKMIPPLVEAGYRVVAPDLIGFGKSDKFEEKEAYSYQSYMDWMNTFIQQLDLQNCTLFCQDWGGLIGLRLAIDQADRFKAIIAANTFLPSGMHAIPAAFSQWKEFALNIPELPVGGIINMGTLTDLSAAVVAAYDAPFPDERFKAAARIFPALVPIDQKDPEAIKNRTYLEAWSKWTKPFLTLFSDSDPITKGGEQFFQKLVPGAEGQAHEIIPNGGHFLQEDQGPLIAQKMVDFLAGL
jgi:haloalkane dehalogenase